MRDKIYIAVLSYNRPNVFKKSLKKLLENIPNLDSKVKYEIKVFDDCSSKKNFNEIKNYTQIFKKERIFIQRNLKNLGYAKNYFSAINWYTKKKDTNSYLYLHESDLYLEKYWLKKCLLMLNFDRQRIIYPLHHRNYLYKNLHSKKIYSNFKKYMSDKLLKKHNVTKKNIFYHEGKFIKKILNVNSFSSYAGIGSRIGNFNFWKIIYNNKKLFFKCHDKEDMLLSFFASKKGTYFVPGSAQIAFNPGLHGYMFLNVASFDSFFSKYIFFNKLKREFLIKLNKIFKFLKIKFFFNFLFK